MALTPNPSCLASPIPINGASWWSNWQKDVQFPGSMMPWKHKQEIFQQYNNIHGSHKPSAVPSTLGLLWRCLLSFPMAARRVGTINNLLGPSVSKSPWGHHKDTLQERMGGCLQWHHPHNWVPFNEHQGQTSPTYILEGQTSTGHNEEAFPTGDSWSETHLNISEPVLILKPVEGQDGRIVQIEFSLWSNPGSAI